MKNARLEKIRKRISDKTKAKVKYLFDKADLEFKNKKPLN